MNKTPLLRRVSRYAATVAAAGLITAPLRLATTGSAAGDPETPAERCQRQTAEYNAAMDTAWRAAHPGQEPTGNEWPPFVCHDIPTPSVSTLPHLPTDLPPGDGGGNGGTGGEPAPERTHHYEGFDRPDSEYRQDMGLGAPRTGLSDRMGTGEPTDTTRPSAGDTARSNVREVTPWATTVTDGNGASRGVRVVDTPDGPAVITDDGTATGEILTTDTVTGVTGVTRQDGLEGRQLTDPTNSNDGRADRADRADRDDTTSATATSAAIPVPGVDDTSDEAAGGDGDNETGGLPVGPLGAGGALAGAAGAILADRRRRDGAHRGDINWGNGREQSLLLLEGVDSPREHRFEMDVAEGGQMVKNPDGSVDVLDADGNVVEHVKAPWAYDALGRPVETHFEVDNETGELVQVVDPERTTLLPILTRRRRSLSSPVTRSLLVQCLPRTLKHRRKQGKTQGTFQRPGRRRIRGSRTARRSPILNNSDRTITISLSQQTVTRILPMSSPIQSRSLSPIPRSKSMTTTPWQRQPTVTPTPPDATMTPMSRMLGGQSRKVAVRPISPA
ncbi:hypothetical protein [Corynebacterium sp.]|uniref:hypothetical protein n=1 Tax=Corynebacterium sp. TaxID=1720 RepID=UPI0028A5950F|nr:hypothetical protein [Corynebacterium sp.]